MTIIITVNFHLSYKHGICLLIHWRRNHSDHAIDMLITADKTKLTPINCIFLNREKIAGSKLVD